jgi:hypothetical protein
MGDVATAAVSDAVGRGRNGVVVGFGCGESGRLESIFGSLAGSGKGGSGASASVSTSSPPRGGAEVTVPSVGDRLGLMGLVVLKLLEEQERSGSSLSPSLEKMEFTLSLIEIVEDDVLRDLLSPPSPSSSLSPPTLRKRGTSSSMSLSSTSSRSSPQKDEEKSLKIRHPDNKGAIVQNAVEVNVKSMEELGGFVSTAFHSRQFVKARKMEGGQGHILATIKVYPRGKGESKTGMNNKNDYNLIQLVDLADAEQQNPDEQPKQTPKKDRGPARRKRLEMERVKEKRAASIRKSLSGLRGILRGLIVQDVQQKNSSSSSRRAMLRKNTQTMSYRECTLTKLLQRALGPKHSRAVVVSSVCPMRQSYRKTLHTLNYVNRLLVRPGQTAESPFDSKVDGGIASPSITGGSPSVAGSSPHGYFGSAGANPLLSPSAGDFSVASSHASEAIRTEFSNLKADKVFLRSLVSEWQSGIGYILSKIHRHACMSRLVDFGS